MVCRRIRIKTIKTAPQHTRLSDPGSRENAGRSGNKAVMSSSSCCRKSWARSPSVPLDLPLCAAPKSFFVIARSALVLVLAYEALMLLIMSKTALQVCLSSDTELASSRNLPNALCMRAAGVPWRGNKRLHQNIRCFTLDVTTMRGFKSKSNGHE